LRQDFSTTGSPSTTLPQLQDVPRRLPPRPLHRPAVRALIHRRLLRPVRSHRPPPSSGGDRHTGRPLDPRPLQGASPTRGGRDLPSGRGHDCPDAITSESDPSYSLILASGRRTDPPAYSRVEASSHVDDHVLRSGPAGLRVTGPSADRDGHAPSCHRRRTGSLSSGSRPPAGAAIVAG